MHSMHLRVYNLKPRDSFLNGRGKLGFNFNDAVEFSVIHLLVVRMDL